MRRPSPRTGLLTIALILIAAMSSLASAGAVQEATPAGGAPEREEELQTANATIRLTLLACEDGVDPQVSPEQCTTPIEAPDTAYVAIAPDMVTYVHTLPVDDDGTYDVPSFPGETISLNEFDRPDYNSFMFEGVDHVERWQASVLLEPDEVRDVTVYYWNGPDGLIEPGENVVSVTVLDCPEGVDPNDDPASCTEPVDAPQSVRVSLPDQAGPLNRFPRDDQGAYTFGDLPPYTNLSLYIDETDAADLMVTGDAESITDEVAEVYAVRGEIRELTVYVYNRSEAEPVEPGAISISVWECPEGVDPAVEASACTTQVDIPDTARVMHRHGLLDVAVADQQRVDDGSYLIEGVTPEAYALGDIWQEGYGQPVVVGLSESGLVGDVIEVQPGETTGIEVYYPRN